MASFSDWLFGSKDKLTQVPTVTKEQQALHNNILAQAMGLSSGGYQQAQNYYNSLLEPGNQAYQNFTAPFINQFQEQTLPQIAERFAGAGALSSSGFGQALGGAASGFQSQLAQLFALLQSQAAGAQTNQYNQLAKTGLNYQPFAYNRQQGHGGILGPLSIGAANAFGSPFGMAAGGIANLFKKSSGGLV